MGGFVTARPRGHLLQGQLGVKNHSVASQGPLSEPLGCPRATCEATAALPAMPRGPEEAPGGTALWPLLGAPRGSPKSPKSLTVQRFSLISEGPRGGPGGPSGPSKRAPQRALPEPPGEPQEAPRESPRSRPAGPQEAPKEAPKSSPEGPPRTSREPPFGEASRPSKTAKTVYRSRF